MTELRFPKLPLYRGWDHPLRVEADVDSLELLEGSVPEGRDGTWYRAGPVTLYDIGLRVRSTFHGCWVPAETFRTHRYAMSRVPAK